MRAVILSVGTELLFGQIVNSNAAYLSQQLNLLGVDVLYHYTVGDNPARLAEMIRYAFRESDLIITTGGLGPTQDDLTKEVVCQVLEDHLVLDPHTDSWLSGLFSQRGHAMTENNKKQAFVPSRATVFFNQAGTAPGFALEQQGKTVISLPGPPREMIKMFQSDVKPYLEKLTQHTIYYRVIRLFGIGESQLETVLMPWIDGQTDPTLATYAKEGESSLRIASKRMTKEEAIDAVDAMIENISSIVGDHIYSTSDEEFHHVVANKLLEKNIQFSCAESCTGGLFAATMTEVPGISAVFNRGYVTYSNQSKIEELDVDPETLLNFGAVSEETAVAMVKGLKKRTGSPLCIAITGISGPGGGSKEKPVGLVYISVIYNDQLVCRKAIIRNVNRTWNRNYAKLLMLDTINRILEGRKIPEIS